MTRQELDKRLEVARAMPGAAHLPSVGLVLAPGQAGPVCQLCGGRQAPIIDGQHLNPARWCETGE
jgi:hypothetical protein